MQKVIVIPVDAVNDDCLSDSEFRLLAKLIIKYGTGSLKNETEKIKFTDADIECLQMRKSTFYRLLSGLIKREYLHRISIDGSYELSASLLELCGLKNETGESQKWDSRPEEERTKEEDKELLKDDSIYNIYNKGVTENEQEREIQKREKPEDESEKADRFTNEYREIIDYLNTKTGKKFSYRSRVNQGHMSARLKEGFTVEDFKRVIDVKWFQWHDDDKMAKFLRPETLFGTKFDRYLNEEKTVTRTDENGWVYTVSDKPHPLDEIFGGADG